MPSKTETLRHSYANYQPLTTETLKARRGPKNEALKKLVKTGGGVLLAAGAVATAESSLADRTIDSVLNRTTNALSVPKPPRAEDASTIRIGDRIRFKDIGGHTLTSEVTSLSDITAAARKVDPDIDYRTFNAMLEGENNNSDLVHGGDAFTVNKDLGIEDIGPSGG